MAVTYKALKAFTAGGHSYAVNATVDVSGWSNRKITQMLTHRFIIPT